MTRSEWLKSLKVGDKVTRMLDGTIPVELTITKIENDLIYLQVPDSPGEEDGDFWIFETRLGCELDPELNSGPPPTYPWCVSFLKQPKEEENAAAK